MVNFEHVIAGQATANDVITFLFYVMNQLAETELAAWQKTNIFIPVYHKPKSSVFKVFSIKRLNVRFMEPLKIIVFSNSH